MVQRNRSKIKNKETFRWRGDRREERFWNTKIWKEKNNMEKLLFIGDNSTRIEENARKGEWNEFNSKLTISHHTPINKYY